MRQMNMEKLRLMWREKKENGKLSNILKACRSIAECLGIISSS